MSEYHTHSDHQAILQVSGEHNNYRRTTWNTSTVSWKTSQFDEDIRLFLTDITIEGETAEEMLRNIMDQVVRACDASRSKRRVKNRRPQVYWWNDEISPRKECHRARRLYQ